MSDTTYTSGLITLENLVDEALLLNNRPESDFKKYLQIAIRGYTDLRIHVVTEGKKTSKLTVNDINRVNFPDDFISFVSIGVVEGGKVWLLSPDKEFVSTTTTTGGTETLDSDQGEGVDIANDYTSKGYYVRGGVNLKGYYQIEWDKRRIALVNCSAQTVLLAYKTSGISLDGQTYIPVKYVMAMQAFIAWWSIANDITVPVSQKQMAEQTYIRMVNKLRKAEGPTLDEWEQGIYKTFYASPKR